MKHTSGTDRFLNILAREIPYADLPVVGALAREGGTAPREAAGGLARHVAGAIRHVHLSLCIYVCRLYHICIYMDKQIRN